MAYKKIEVIEDVKKKYVRMALETGNNMSVARKAGVDARTLKSWMKEYQDEVREAMDKEGIVSLSTDPTKEELMAKYEHAMKLLGEKELEVAVLKDLLKKNGSM